MKKILFAALVVLAALPMSASAQMQEAYPSYVQVNGRAEKEVTPDEFYLQIVINERDSKGKISVQEQEKEMLAALRRLNIATDKQLTRSNLSSEFYRKNQTLSMAKYQLKLTSAAQLATAWQALSDLGISNVSLLKVSHSQIEELKREVRLDAMRNARSCAEELAGAIGQSVGKCFYIVDYNNDVVPTFYKNNMMMARGLALTEDAAAMDDEEPALDFKTIKLSYNIQAKFVLE